MNRRSLLSALGATAMTPLLPAPPRLATMTDSIQTRATAPVTFTETRQYQFDGRSTAHGGPFEGAAWSLNPAQVIFFE